MSKEGGEALRRWEAALQTRTFGIKKGKLLDDGIVIYSATDDREYMRAAHLAMASRDPAYPERVKAARAKARALANEMLREMVKRGMIPAHMGPAEPGDGEEAA